MNTIEGVIEQVGQKEVVTARGQATSYSLKINGEWLSAGFKAPKVSKGQTARVVYTTNGKYKNVDSVEVIDAAPKVAAAPQATGTDWDAKDKRIALMSCRNSALQLAELAIAAGATPFLPAKKEDKFDALEAFVAMQTQKYFEQLYTDGFKFEDLLQQQEKVQIEEE